MADAHGRPRTIKPLYRVDGRITDQKPPASENRKTEKVELTDEPGRYLVTLGPPRPAPVRPAFPRRPLNPSSVDPSDLSAAEKAELIRWIRKAQPDFDPEADQRGWISVGVLLRQVGYTEEEIRRMDYPQLEHVFRSLWPKMNLERTGSISFAPETSTATIVHIGGDLTPAPAGEPSNVLRFGSATPATDRAAGEAELGSKGGPQKQKRRLRPEEHLVILYGRDPKVATLESRSLPDLAQEQLGESFSDRAYRETGLYKEWRTALEDSLSRHGQGWMEGDVLEAGLEIYGAKPGRSDKRKTLDTKHEAAVRAFLREAANATARAKQRLEDGGK